MNEQDSARRSAFVLALFVLVLAAPAAAQQEPPPAATSLTETLTPEHAVVLTYMNRPITALRARVLANTPARRADAAISVLDRLVNDKITGPVKERMVDGVLFIAVGDHDVLSLVSADVDRLAGETIEGRGAEAAKQLQIALNEAEESRRFGRITRGVAISLAITVAYVLALLMMARLRRRATAAVAALAGRELDRVDARSWWAERDILIARFARLVAMAVLLVVAILLTYQWVTFVMRQFPYSRPWGETLRYQLLTFLSQSALDVAHALPGLLLIALIIAVTRVAIGVSNAFFDSVERGKVSVAWTSPDTARASRRIVATALWLFAVVIAYPYVPGSGTDAFKGVSVFVGLVISLGSSGLVNQLISGLTLTYSHALSVGDVIRTGDVEGRVTRMGMLSIQVRTAEEELVTAPNAVVVGQTTTNYTRLVPDGGTCLSTEVTIGYNVPWRQVHALLLLAAARTEGVQPAPPPRVLQRALEDFYVRYRLVVFIRTGLNRADALNTLLANVLDAFNEHSVQIMSPNYEADPEHPAIVPREQWYAPPASAPGTVSPAGTARARR